MAKLHQHQPEFLSETEISSNTDSIKPEEALQDIQEENSLNEKEQSINSKDIFSPKIVLRNCAILIVTFSFGIPASKLLGFEFKVDQLYPYIYQLFFLVAFWANKKKLNNWIAIYGKNFLAFLAWGICWLAIIGCSIGILYDLIRYSGEY